MILRPLTIACPSCGSTDVTYTCEPKCCFNHICAACYTTFELATEALGRRLVSAEWVAFSEKTGDVSVELFDGWHAKLARDERELVGRGRHERVIIDLERFRQRLAAKSGY